jgi:hypothetical protein
MRYLLLLTLISGCILPVTFDVSAQDTQSAETNNTRYVRLFLQNGGMFEGEVLEIDESTFLINTLDLGKMRITKTDISSITYITADEVGQMTKSNRKGDLNPQPTRYFFAPSGLQLKKGEGYYQNAWLIYNQVSYGVSDHFTVGMSMTPYGTGGTVKLGTKLSDKVNVSAGGIALIPFTGDDAVGIGFANITFGDERKNFSISSGVGFSDGGDNITLLNVSAMLEVSSSLWIITENYQIFQTSSYSGNPDNVTIISMGIRRASQKRDILWDYALVAIPSEEVFGIPWLSCTIPF